MCLGRIANKIFGSGGSKSAPQTPDPVGKESPTVQPLPVETSDKKQTTTQKKSVTANDASQGNTGNTSMTNTGINY